MVTARKKYFHSMAQHFNITPSTKHYACVVHVLARAGNLEQVLEFIYKKFKAGAELLFRVLGCKSKSYSDIQEVSGTVFLLRISGA